MGERRVAVISDAGGYVGPSLARLLAPEHDLVVGDPEDGLVADLEAAGAAVAVADETGDLSRPEVTERLVSLAIDRFGRLDAAVAFTGRIVVGRFLRSGVEDLPRRAGRMCGGALPVPAGHRAGDGQTAAAAKSWCSPAPPALAQRPVPRCASCGGQPPTCSCATSPRKSLDATCRSMRSARTSWTSRGSCGRTGPRNPRAARVEALVPMGRLGTMDELAHMALPFVDGTSRFTTGQFVGFAGGWV